MSATARDFVYQVKVTEKSGKKPEPTISKEKLDEYRANIEKYLCKRDEK